MAITGSIFFIYSLIVLAVLVLFVRFLLLGIKYFQRELNSSTVAKKSDIEK